MNLLQIDDLSIVCTLGEKKTVVVDSVSFFVRPGEILSLVGESGSGKTTVARAIMRLFSSESLSIVNGAIYLNGENILEYDDQKMGTIRGKKISYIPQSPAASFDYLMTIEKQILETYQGSADEGRKRALYLLERCGFQDPERVLSLYPNELSGGMLQRIAIILALINHPSCVIADEPTTALDAVTQSEVLNVLTDLVKEEKSALLFITHDLHIVSQISDRVLIMKNGRFIDEQDRAYNMSGIKSRAIDEK